MKNWEKIGLFLLSLLLYSCDETTHYAPITEMSFIEPIPKGGNHGVKAGETLYEVAWRYGMDYRKLSELNQLSPPYQIKPGQVIQLKTIKAAIKSPKPKRDQSIRPNLEPDYAVKAWAWPAKGKVIKTFSALNKGINISGFLGDPIYAVGSGKVVYAGEGLKRYGNLIIIKHNSLFLTAYAHNQKLLVKEGEWVNKGQKIAEMGNVGTNQVMLHFEIRKAGKPIDPYQLLATLAK